MRSVRKLFASHNQDPLTRQMRAEGCWGGGSEGCEDAVGDYVYEFRTTGVHAEVGAGSCRDIRPGRIRELFSCAAVIKRRWVWSVRKQKQCRRRKNERNWLKSSNSGTTTDWTCLKSAYLMRWVAASRGADNLFRLGFTCGRHLFSLKLDILKCSKDLKTISVTVRTWCCSRFQRTCKYLWHIYFSVLSRWS